MKENYYLGLDIGTNSVGYAVTDGGFNLLKYKGEPMWGSHVFEEGKQCSDRRMHRTARRRLDRRQQRVHLTQEIFAKAISEVDERFFVRLKESALFREDTSGRDTYIFFQDKNYTDKEYHRDYPTIHHLIKELMEDTTPHDVRLVYLAVAWLMAHRGHFLSEVNKDNITELLDFDSIYGNLMELFTTPPWICSDKEEFKNILLLHQTIKNKERKFWGLLYEGKKPKTDEEDYINKEGMIRLLSGGTVEAGKLFNQKEFQEKISISLKKSEEDFQLLLDEMDEEDSEYLIRLRALYDWALLVDSLHGCSSISEAKVQDYIQHEADLKMLKSFVRKYCPNEYATIFKNAEKENYASYVYNIPKGKRTKEYKKKITQEEFCDYLKKKLKDVQIDEEDEEIYQDMMFRLETYTFMPKQVTGDNRVIPYQLYYDELKKILKNAENYLPFLKKEDEQGISNKTKLLSIFEFRIPYYVGPLCSTSKYAWLKRKSEGKIYPWNFEEKVDLDQSEEAFINRMTNNCSYLPGKTVLPQNSLLYCKFTVLNEINNLKINGIPISVECKQEVYKLFQENKKVTVDKIKKYLISNNYMTKEYVRNTIAQIIGKPRDVVQEVSFPLGMRKIKVNTLLTFDGFEATLASKSSKGQKIVFGSMMPLFVAGKKEQYIKRLESFYKKKKQNNSLLVDEVYDKITKEENRELFLFLTNKVKEMPYCLIFGSQLQVLHDKENEFKNLKLEQQVETLLNVLSIFKTGRTTGCDLKALGGARQAGIFTESSKLSNWKKSYKDVRIVDISAAGLHRKISQNLLELL